GSRRLGVLLHRRGRGRRCLRRIRPEAGAAACLTAPPHTSGSRFTRSSLPHQRGFPKSGPMTAEAPSKELGLSPPAPPKPRGKHNRGVRVGNLLYLSGHGPSRVDGAPAARGKVGRDLSVEEAYKVARDVGINLLGTARSLLGSLDKVKRVVKVLGMVNSAEGFGDQPKVINAFSDLMDEVFGEKGRHARSAVGMAELPSSIPVEIEMILEVE